MGSSASTNNKTQSRPPRPKSSPPPRKAALNGDAGGGQKRDAPKSAAARITNPGDPPNYHRSQIPPPRPPRTSKADIFTTAKYKEVDDYVLNAPPKLLVGNFNELVKYLTRDNERWDDMCKLRAIFLWVTSIDVYNLKVDGVPPTHSPLEYFTKIQCNMGNHAHLISGLCQMAGIPCVIISGMNKSAAYDIGSKCDRKSMGAQWNAVYINDDWRFLDAFWASACVVGRKSGEWTLVDSDGNVTQEDEETSEGTTQHRINEFYFLPDPDKIVWTHFPDEPQWQLMDRPVTQREFEEHVYMRERFHYLGMKLMPNSHDKCLLTANDGELELVFSLPVQQSETSRFKYMLYQGRSERGEQQADDLFLDRFVMFEHTANLLRFTLRFPIKGKFKMDIFGLDINESDIFDLACTYIINCTEPKANCLPLPDLPPIGWGPGANAKEAGLKPITHDGAIIVTKDGNVEIRLAADKDIQLHQMLKHALIDEATLSNYAVTRLENGEAVVNIRLPQGGEYALKLYADAAGNEGSAPNVLNYLIKSDAKNINNQPFPNVADGTLGKKPAAANLGVKAISHKGGNIQAKNGRARVEFQARTGVQVMVELHSSNEMACKTMAVTPREENGKWTFDLDMPDQGEYSLNVFACNKNSTDRIYNVHTYLVHSDGRKLEPGELDARNENKNVLTNIPIETVQTSDNEVLIPVPPGFENVAASLHRRNANDPPNANQVDIIEQDGMQLIRAKLPEFGEYLLNLYDRDTSGVVRNIAKYQINRRPPGELYEDNTKMLMSSLGAQAPIMEEDEEEYTPHKPDKNETDEEKKKRLEEEQRRATRRQIQKAIDMKDSEMLERYIQQYQKLNPPFDDELLQKARRTLAALDAKEALTEACQRRDLDSLKKAITRAKEANFDHQLDLQLALANRLKDQLERIEKLRHSVLNLDTKTIAEIKTYSNPPDGVHQSMMATFILLGNVPKEVKSWRTCQALVGKTGRESLMRRISSFDPKDCNIAVAQQAKYYIENYSMSQIRDVSAGAATFYGWFDKLCDFVREVTNFVLCQPDKSNLAYINCKTGRREFTPTDNEQPGPSNVLSISPEHESNSLLRKHRSHSGVQRYLSISATENIDLLPAEKDKQQTAMTMIGAKSSTDIYNASIDNGFHEKQGDKTVNRKDNSQIIQNNNVELERNAMPILSSKSGSPNDDKSARMETDIRSDVEPTGQESYIFNSTERRDTNALRESETIDKLDVNGNFSSINWTANTIYTRNDSDHSETTCDGSDIKDTENTHLISRKQQITNDTSFNVNASVVDSLHAGDSELHEGNSSQNDTNSNTIVISSTQNSCTNLHDKNINGDIYVAGNGKVESNKDTPRVTCKERPEREDSEEEETRCNRKISHSAGSIEVDSRNNDHQETNTNIDSNSVGENIKCTNSYPYDQDHDWHRITNKERDSDLLSVKGQQARISNRLVIIATESCCCIPDDFTRHDTNARATLNETNAILRNELIDSNKHGTNNRQDDILSSVCNKNESSDESKQDMTEIKNYRENYDDRNINRPDCRGLSENETHINAERTNRAHLVESDDRTAEKPNSSIKSYENKIVIPTGNGEESSESDHTDSECETDIETKTNVDEDVADLKILLELTTGRRFSCVEHAITDKINQNNEMVETTSGRPCKDYVQFVREKTMETAKTKKIKKVKPKNTEKKDKLHKQFITHGKAVKTKDSNDAPPHKTKVTTEKKLKPKQGRSTKKKKKTL